MTGEDRPDRKDRKDQNGKGRRADEQQGTGGGRERDVAPRQSIDVADVIKNAAVQLAQLLKCEPSSVSAVQATDEGWAADVEVLELAKVPDTASVMATYRVRLDDQGQLTGYERTRRYAKGQTDL